MIDYKVRVIVIFNIVITVHKYMYEENNVDFNIFLNCCKIGNCITSLARPFQMCTPLTVIDISLRVVFAFIK